MDIIERITVVAQQVEKGVPVSPGQFLDLSLILLPVIHRLAEEIIGLEQVLAQKRAALVSDGAAASVAKLLVEADPDFGAVRLLKAKKDIAQDFILLAKRQSYLDQSY